LRLVIKSNSDNFAKSEAQFPCKGKFRPKSIYISILFSKNGVTKMIFANLTGSQMLYKYFLNTYYLSHFIWVIQK